MTVRQWLGCPVIDMRSAETVGRIVRLLPAEGGRALLGFALRPMDGRLPPALYPWEALVPGRPALARSAPLPLEPGTPYWSSWERTLPLGRPGFSPDGAPVGRCTDIELDGEGRFAALLFSSGLRVPAGELGAVGSAAVMVGRTPESAPPESADRLIGRRVTQDIYLADGTLLAAQGQTVDGALAERAQQAGRTVALTLRSQPAAPAGEKEKSG